jgi:Gram-negative bacterial tonB protein.
MDQCDLELEELYAQDVVRRTSRAFHPCDVEEKQLKEQFKADRNAGIEPRNSASYRALKEYRKNRSEKPQRKVSVIVSMFIERDGAVHSIELIEQSGYDFVDAAALAAAQHAAPFRPVPMECDCPFRSFVKMYCFVPDSSTQTANITKPPPRQDYALALRRLVKFLESFGGWQKVMSSEFIITDEFLDEVERTTGFDKGQFCSIRKSELMDPRIKRIRRAAADLVIGWTNYQQRISPKRAIPHKGRQEWEFILTNFWHLHGEKFDELGISIDDVVEEIATGVARFPNIDTELFFELTQIRRPEKNT